MKKRISIILIVSLLINLIEPYIYKTYAIENIGETKQIVIGYFDVWCRSDGTTWLPYKNELGKNIVAKPAGPTITNISFPIASQPNKKVKNIEYFSGDSSVFDKIPKEYGGIHDLNDFEVNYKPYSIAENNLDINKEKAIEKSDGIRLYLNSLNIPINQKGVMQNKTWQNKNVQGLRFYIPVVVTFEDINPPPKSIDVDFANEAEVLEGQDINFEDKSKTYPIGANEIQKEKLYIQGINGTNYNEVRDKNPKDVKPAIRLMEGQYKLILEGWDVANNYDKKEGYVTVKKAQNPVAQIVAIEKSPITGEIGQPFLVSAKESFTNKGMIVKWKHYVSIGNTNNFQPIADASGGNKEEFYYTGNLETDYYFKVEVETNGGLKATSMPSKTSLADNTNANADAEIETEPIWYEGIYEYVYNKSTITISNSKDTEINGTWDVSSDVGRRYSSNYWSIYDLFQIPKVNSKYDKDNFNSDAGGNLRFNTVGEREINLLLKGAGGSSDTDTEVVDVRALPLARLEVVANKKNREVQIKDISMFKPQNACQDGENAVIDDTKTKITITNTITGEKAVSIGGSAFNSTWIKGLTTEYKVKQEEDSTYNHIKDNLTRVVFVGDNAHDQKTEVFKIELEVTDKRGKTSKTEETVTIYGDKKPTSKITGIWNYIRNPITKIAETELYEASYSSDEDDIEVSTKKDGTIIQPNITDRKLNISSDKVGENKIENTVVERFIEKVYSGLRKFLVTEDELKDVKSYILNIINIAPTASLKGIKSSNVNMISYIDTENDLSSKINTMIQELLTENKVKVANTPLVYEEEKGLYKTKGTQSTSITVLDLLKAEMQLRTSSGLGVDKYKFYPVNNGLVISKILGSVKTVTLKKIDGSTTVVGTVDRGSKTATQFYKEIPILDDEEAHVESYVDIETLPHNLKYSNLFYVWSGGKETYLSEFETSEEYKNTFFIDNGKLYGYSVQDREDWWEDFNYQSFIYDLTTKTTQYYNEDEKSKYIKLRLLNALSVNFNTSITSMDKLKAKIGENYSAYITKPISNYYKVEYGVETPTYVDFYIKDTNNSTSTYIDTIKYYRYNKIRNAISLLNTLTFNKGYSQSPSAGYRETKKLCFVGKVGDKYMAIYVHAKPIPESSSLEHLFDSYVVDTAGNALKHLSEFRVYGSEKDLDDEDFYMDIQGNDDMLTFIYAIDEWSYHVTTNVVTFDRVNDRFTGKSFLSEYNPFFNTPYRVLLSDRYGSENRPRYATLNLEDNTTRRAEGYWHEQGFSKRKEFSQAESWQTRDFSHTYLKLTPSSTQKETFGDVVGYEDDLVYINTSSGLTGWYPSTNETVNFNMAYTKPSESFLEKVNFDYRDLKEYDKFTLSPKFIDFTYKLDNISITKQKNNFLTLYVNKDIMFGDIETQVLKDRIDYLNERNNLVNEEKIKLLIIDNGGKNEASFQTLISQVGGQYFKVNSDDEGILKVKEYIQGISGAIESSDTIRLKQGDIIDIVGTTLDYEEDPLKLEQYRLKGQSWGSFGANSGIVKMGGNALQFNNIGTFLIEYQSKDNPPSADGKDYGKFSNIPYLTVIVGDAPIDTNPEPPNIDIKILSLDGENKGKERRKVDFIIQGIKGTNEINWSSLKVSFDKNDYLPTLSENNFTNKKAFSRIFTQLGTHNVTVELADMKGLKRTVTIPFEIIEDSAPDGNFDIIGDGKRNPSTGLAQYFISNESASSPDGDNFETIYYNEVPKYKFVDGKLIQDGIGWGELDTTGGMFETDNSIKIRQLVQEIYENGKGLNGEDLDKEGYRVFKNHEVIKTQLVVKTPPTLQYEVKPNIILKGEKVSHFSTIKDDTNKPKKQEFKFVHNPNIFQNNQGINPLNNTITSTATEQLNYKGEYRFYSKVDDEDGMTSNWVDGGIVKVVSKPISDFEPYTTSVDLDSRNKEYENDIFGRYSNIEITNKAYNEDYGTTRADRGFKTIKMEYRSLKNDTFTEFYNNTNVTSYPVKFTLPSTVSQNYGIYEIKQTVVSIDGIKSEATKTIKVVDFKLKAELDPSMIHAGDTYKIKAKVGKDSIGAIAYIPYLNKYIDLIESYEDADSAYYEIPIPTLQTMKDGDYPIVVYGLYPYNIKKKADLLLKVYTPITMASDIIPLGTSEYNSTLEHHSPDGDYIKVASSENIRIEATVNCPIEVLQVEAWLEGEGSTFLWYNATSGKWEGMVSVRNTKLDKNYYEVKLRATAVNTNFTENTHKAWIYTPINLNGYINNLNSNALLFLDQNNELKATTTKYANSVTVNILGSNINMTLASNDGKIKTWKATKFADISLGEITGTAKFTATTANGNSEIKNVGYKTILPLDITGSVDPVPVWAGYWVTITANTDGYAEDVELTFKGGKDNGEKYQMTPVYSTTRKTNTWKLKYQTWKFEPDGNIPVELRAIRGVKDKTTIVNIVIKDSYLDHRKASVKQ